jgi:GTPase Era involved in 16S rRNA processing
MRSAPNAAMTRKVRNSVRMIDITLLTFFSTKKFTTGWSTIAKMVAKTTGTRMLLAMYRIVRRTAIPISKMLAFT